MTEKKQIKQRLDQFRNQMLEKKIDVYYIPTDDFHGSEFVSEYFKVREFLSGFTGSAGTLILTLQTAALFTDGRYFLQAEEELSGIGIDLYKTGMPGVPTMLEYLSSCLKDGMCLGFDGRCVNAGTVMVMIKQIRQAGKNITIDGESDLISSVWLDRPKLPNEPAYILDEKYAGESVAVKLEKVRQLMKVRNAHTFILTALDDIAWLLNIRGNDVKCNPVCLSYMILTMESAYFYCKTGERADVMLAPVYEHLIENGITIKSYFSVYEDIKKIDTTPENGYIIADLDKVNYRLFHEISIAKILNILNPTTTLKAVKNETEIKNEKNAHIKDAVAYIRFLYWFKKRLKENTELTELLLASKLLQERQKMEGFVSESFEPIVAYGAHGAIVHYSPDEESNLSIEPKSFVLIDTGGHYLEGTTDITRTIACGTLTEEERRHYTLVLKGNLALGNAVFLNGTTGANLDILARQPLWEQGMDYNHGTGHGVGYLLNVHEGPNNIRYKIGSGKNISAVIKPGMITSNEPGLYISGKYGIRIENMIVCKEKETNDFGTFFAFDTLTLVPFERDAIQTELLTETEIRLINEYHKKIYEIISPFLTDEEAAFLCEITKEL